MQCNILYQKASPSNPAKAHLTVKCEGKSVPLAVGTVDLAQPAKVAEFVDGLVEKYPGINKETFNDELLELADRLLNSERDDGDDGDESEPVKPLDLSKIELNTTSDELIRAAQEFGNRPDLFDLTTSHMQALGLAGEKDLAGQLYVIGTSRLAPNPLAGAITSGSASGKSYSVNTVCSAMPPEAVFKAHRMTPQALMHLPEGSLERRLMHLGERSRDTSDEVAENTRNFRELIEDHECRQAITQKGPDGKFVTTYRVQKGPVAWIETTTLGPDAIFTEDRTRLLMLCANESSEQTQRVLDWQAANAMAPADPDEIETIRKLHHTFQRLLQPKRVKIPFAGELTRVIPNDRLEARRAFAHLLAIIQAIAILHQFQREAVDSDTILALPADYEIARRVFADPLGRSIGRTLTTGAQMMLDRMDEEFDARATFTAHEIEESTGVARSSVYDRLRELRKSGHVRLVESGSGPVPARYGFGVPSEAAEFFLPCLSSSDARTLTMPSECKSL